MNTKHLIASAKARAGSRAGARRATRVDDVVAAAMLRRSSETHRPTNIEAKLAAARANLRAARTRD